MIMDMSREGSEVTSSQLSDILDKKSKRTARIRWTNANQYASFEEKKLETMQLCIRCGRTLLFKKGRKSCPCCCGSLAVKTIVVKNVYATSSQL